MKNNFVELEFKLTGKSEITKVQISTASTNDFMKYLSVNDNLINSDGCFYSFNDQIKNKTVVISVSEIQEIKIPHWSRGIKRIKRYKFMRGE